MKLIILDSMDRWVISNTDKKIRLLLSLHQRICQKQRPKLHLLKIDPVRLTSFISLHQERVFYISDSSHCWRLLSTYLLSYTMLSISF